MSHTAPEHVQLKPNVGRIVAALHFVISQAHDRGRNVSQYDLVKTLFLADRAHLNAWGRPVTYDNYAAMYHGPVPSLAYDLLKGNVKAMRDYGIQDLPWTSIPQGKGKKNYFPMDHALDPQEHLSPSDIEVLTEALGVVLSLGFGQIRRLTHEDPAYLDAWRDDGGRAAYAMKLGLFFEEPNFEQAAAVAEHSSHV